MREIRFRAKRTDNDEWLYGCYIYEGDEHIIVEKGTGYNYFVDEKTIGEFTGFYDRNGKEIYEGDLVRATFNYEPKSLVEKAEEFEDVLCEVFFMYGCFKLRLANSQISVNLENAWNIEVVGNIHDEKEIKSE